jgi:hypothetical protein
MAIVQRLIWRFPAVVFGVARSSIIRGYTDAVHNPRQNYAAACGRARQPKSIFS